MARKPRKSIWDLAPDAVAIPPAAAPSDPRIRPPDDGWLPEEEPSKKTFADVDGIEREAAKFAKGLFGFLLWMDSKFVEKGQPPLSPWWRFSLAEFFESDKVWAAFMVGRGGGKSTSLVRVALLYTLFGCLFTTRKVPPGQRWIWPFISAHTTDAGRRINEAQALLTALGLETKPKGHQGSRTIEMVDVQQNDVALLSLAATIAGVSGPSALGGTVDEEAKLRDRAQNVNPATEIIASIAQMFRARPGVHAIRCSSAWFDTGSHYATIQEGTTIATYVARIGEAFLPATIEGLTQVASWERSQGNEEGARKILDHAAKLGPNSPNVPTWVANPTISAMAARAQVEATPVATEDQNTPRWRIWLRENASVPLSVGEAGGAWSVDEFTALGSANRRLAKGATGRGAGTFREDGLILVPGYGDDFKPIPGAGKGRGRL